MDLASTQPRRPRTVIAGLAMAARTADKARAANDGTLGTFKYNCSMDNKMFAFAGIDASERHLAAISTADDRGAEALLLRKLAGKPDDEAAGYNSVILEWAVNPNGGNC